MMRPLFDIEITKLKNDIEANSLILTPNNRLATKIRQAWGQYQYQYGHSCWESPQVHAIEQWINEQWLQYCDAGVSPMATGAIVTPTMEQLLWEQAIDQDTAKPTQLLPSNFAQLAHNSYSIIQRWKIPLPRIKEDSPLLWRWIQTFNLLLKKHHLITPADSACALSIAVRKHKLTPHTAIVLVGFNSIPPLYQTLIEQYSTQIKTCTLNAQVGLAQRTQFYDEQQALKAVAAWADEKQQVHPNHRIGIVIPDLARTRAQVERTFRQQFDKSYSHPTQPRTAPPFNISAGIPLSTTPLIATALLLLALNRHEVILDDLCRLLNYPFWGAATSLSQSILRANIEKRLRKLARYQLNSIELRYQAHLAAQSMPNSDLSHALEAAANLQRSMPSTASFQQWLTLFQQQLDLLSWPGPRTLDSIEYQQYQHWLHSLEQYLSLDQLGRKVDLYEALRQLKQLLDRCIFQPETNDSPIQILGLLESSGLHFDYLWVMGMDHQHWPPRIAPNPLLPFKLQQEYGTPRSSPERELILAQDQIRGFMHAANEVVFSYSEYDATQQRQVSKLIADLPEVDHTTLISTIALDLPTADMSSVALETVNCEYGPPLELNSQLNRDTPNSQIVLGGSSILKDQASCPFNAFARHRLGATSPPEPQLGLSAMDRGTIVHQCLERIWQQLGCQQTLLELSDDQLNESINSTILSSLQHWEKTRPDLFGQEFSQLEVTRLTSLLAQWLAVEKTRPTFKVVGFEQSEQICFSDLPLRLTIDRVDELEDGRKVIIDYKTGSVKTNQWLGDRPEQPQIPLYVLCSTSPVAAATFAVINVTSQQFVGFSETDNALPNVTPPGHKNNEPESWSELLHQWQRGLTQLADEFKQGLASVQFYHINSKQYQQELEPLNRIAELNKNHTIEHEQ